MSDNVEAADVVGPRDLYELRIRLIDKHRANERARARARRARMVRRAALGTIALAVCLAGGAAAAWGAR